jgi:hypothetical protein
VRREILVTLQQCSSGNKGKASVSAIRNRKINRELQLSPLHPRPPSPLCRRDPLPTRYRDRPLRLRRVSEGRIAELERKIGQQTLEIDFLKGCLQRIEEQGVMPR